MTKKLYRVTCKGMTYSSTGVAHGVAYVVAENPDAAYKAVREDLDKRSLGNSRERELDKVELLAEAAHYPECGATLYA
jgi:hypothetical protein